MTAPCPADADLLEYPCRKLFFVGNSHTYQPKELGGIPNAVTRLAAAASGAKLEVDSVTKGGADLVDVWEEFAAFVQGAGQDRTWDTFVLQVGRGADKNMQFAIAQVLEHRYAPLLLEGQPDCRVLLYQTWSGPRPLSNEVDLLAESIDEYRAVLLAAGIREVLVARAANAFLAVRDASALDKCVYPALWKDDMGHGSALAGALVAAVMVLSLGLGPRSEGRQRPLGRMLEAMLPNAWRTASPGYAGDIGFAQKGWRDEFKGAPALVMDLVGDPDEDLPLNKYPPGMRTERRDLSVAFGDILAAAAAEAVKMDQPQNAVVGSNGLEGYPSNASAAPAAQDLPAKSRRWQAATGLASCAANSCPADTSSEAEKLALGKPRRWQKR